jgi:hypothetical protein
VRRSGRAAATRANDRDQGAARRFQHSHPVALDLLRRFAPPRPVRLLGVRVAGLELPGSAVEDQLSLVV